jgi:hypothetical protein
MGDRSWGGIALGGVLFIFIISSLTAVAGI